MNLNITASGTIDLMPNQPGNALATPDGFGQRVGGQVILANGGVAQAAGKARGGRAQQQFGSLMGKIGDRGRPFVVGSKYQGVAAEEGKLYLRILPGPYNVDSSGTYDVQVNSER